MLQRWYNTFFAVHKRKGDIILKKQFSRVARVSLSRRGQKKIYIIIDGFLLKANPCYKWSVAALQLFVFSFAILINVYSTGKKTKQPPPAKKKINYENQRTRNRCDLLRSHCRLPKVRRLQREATDLGRCGVSVCRLAHQLTDGSRESDVNWPCLWRKGTGLRRRVRDLACRWWSVTAQKADFVRGSIMPSDVFRVWTRMRLKNRLWWTRACRLINHLLLSAWILPLFDREECCPHLLSPPLASAELLWGSVWLSPHCSIIMC